MLRSQRRPAVAQVGVERRASRAAEQRDALLAALADDAQLAAAQIEVGQPRRGELADAQPGGVRGLDDGQVAQREGRLFVC